MDPNANLEEQRRIITSMQDGTSKDPVEWAQDSQRLAELVQALDEWISKGGALPKAWSR